MKIDLIVFTFLIGICTSSCNSILSDSGGPGLLGAVEIVNLNCASEDVDRTISMLLTDNEFKIEIKDSTVVDYWKVGGFDFLNYRCLKIRKSLYMITVDSESDNETTIGIRSCYNRQNKRWNHAKKFSALEKYRARKAMERLMKEFDYCK